MQDNETRAAYRAAIAKAFPKATPDDVDHLVTSYPHKTDSIMASVLRVVAVTKIVRRKLVERAVVRSAATELTAAGYFLRVYDGEDWASERTQDVGEIMAAIMSVDEESLAVLRVDTRTVGEGRSPSGFLRCGTISLVYGNDGYDVMCDYSSSLEKHLKATNALADELASAS